MFYFELYLTVVCFLFFNSICAIHNSVVVVVVDPVCIWYGTRPRGVGRMDTFRFGSIGGCGRNVRRYYWCYVLLKWRSSSIRYALSKWRSSSTRYRSKMPIPRRVPSIGREPLFKVVRPFEDAVRSFSPPFAVRYIRTAFCCRGTTCFSQPYIRTAFCCRGTTCFSQPWLGSGIFLLHYRHNVYVHIPLPSLFVIIS